MMVIIKNNTSVDKDVKKLEPSHTSRSIVKLVQSLWKTDRQFLDGLNIEPSYPKELKTYVHTKMCT